jgi:Na+/H+ antiporter NhaD/arsenite permease-like protein
MAEGFGTAKEPFALVLALTANIGSALTLIGNPQNILIASASGMGFIYFIIKVAPAVLASLAFNNVAVTLCYLRAITKGSRGTVLSDQYDRGMQPSLLKSAPHQALIDGREDDPEAHRLSEAPSGFSGSARPPPQGVFTTFMNAESRDQAILIAVLLGLMIGVCLPGACIAWVVLACSATLVVTEAFSQPKDREPTEILKYIDGPLLMLFAGLFVVMGGARAVQMPQKLENAAGAIGWKAKPEFDTWENVVMYASFVMFLSQICSNVPTVMLLNDPLLNLAHDNIYKEMGFVILSFSATVGGNLTLVGSIANLIVAEKAKLVGYEMTFSRHLYFGAPSTVVVGLVGSLIVWWCY